MGEVLTFGEAMVVVRGCGPLRLGGPAELSVAGAESNVAIGLARLGHGVTWVGRVGDDEPGRLVERTLRAEGVHTGGVRVDAGGPTGLLLAEQRLGTLTRVTYYRSGSAGSRLEAADVLPAITPGLGFLHVTGVTAALSATARESVLAAVRRAREVGALVSLDVNHRSRLWSVADARRALAPVLGSVDLLFASADELPVVSDRESDEAASVADLLRIGVSEVVVKLGHEGARAYVADGVQAVAAKPVRVVDVVGAGDAFVAGYLSGRLDGLDLTGRLDRAGTTASFCVARHGDWEGLPSRHELALLDLEVGATVR